MEKRITLNLTDTEYKKLMELYHLGYMVEDSITEKSQQRMLQEIDFMEKISQQAYDCGSRNVFLGNGMYGITKEMEDNMLENLEGFKDFIYSGQDALEDAIVEQNVREILKKEKAGSKKRK